MKDHKRRSSLCQRIDSVMKHRATIIGAGNSGSATAGGMTVDKSNRVLLRKNVQPQGEGGMIKSNTVFKDSNAIQSGRRR